MTAKAAEVQGSIERQVAVVTGGARGIGFAVARRLTEAGAAVVIADRDGSAAEAAAECLGRGGATTKAICVDISDGAQVETMLGDTCAALGGVDVLVNNAAHARYAFALDLAESDWRYTVDVCLTGTFMCAQRAARLMAAQGHGKIVNISSISAAVGLARTAAYASAKGGIEALTRVMAVELAEAGVQVNAIAPGPIDTEFSREVVTEAGRRARIARIPGGTLGQPEDVAGAVLFLVSPAASWITGTTLTVDGGYTIAGAIEKDGSAR